MPPTRGERQPCRPLAHATVNDGVYTDPTTSPTASGDDVTQHRSGDTVSKFSNIALHGDFYNGMRGNDAGGPGPEGLNMELMFDSSRDDGMISATTTQHVVNPISAANYEDLGEVANTVPPVVNNGVIVDLENGSDWKVRGTSYLSSPTLDATSQVTAPAGETVTMPVSGTPAPITLATPTPVTSS